MEPELISSIPREKPVETKCMRKPFILYHGFSIRPSTRNLVYIALAFYDLFLPKHSVQYECWSLSNITGLPH